MKKNIIAIAVVAVIAAGAIYFLANMPVPADNADLAQNQKIQTPADSNSNVAEESIDMAATSSEAANVPVTPPAQEPRDEEQTVIGKSANGRDITAYHLGDGSKEILFVAGIHGGYAWKTALLGYQLVDYLNKNPNTIPDNIKITIIPALNIDGLAKVMGSDGPFLKIVEGDGPFLPLGVSGTDLSNARFNANNVDLNRNFDCQWQSKAVWQDKTVNAGNAAFSEPESAAIRDYAQNHPIAAVIAWYVSGGGVYASSCGNGILPETQTIMDLYANASGYSAHKNFESYQISGDMTDWFAKNNVPAIGVLLGVTSATENTTQFSKNLAGVKSVLEHYSK